MSPEEKWNEMIGQLSELELPVEDPFLQQMLLVYHYFSEMESGGHESLFRWLEMYVKDTGIDFFIAELSDALEHIGAIGYVDLVQIYGKPIWQAYEAMNQDETVEDSFYEVVETADEQYHGLGGIGELVERYFLQQFEKINSRIASLE